MSSNRRTRVLVLYGGRSAEHEVSILSARFIVRSLDPERFEPILVGITHEGRWHRQEREQLLESAADARTVSIRTDMPEAYLPPVPARSGEGAAAFLLGANSTRYPVDVAFPVLHGPMGEDGCMQGLLELAGLPYVGAGVLGSALGMDKEVQRRLLARADVPVLPFECVRSYQWADDAGAARPSLLDRCLRLGLPLFVKPVNMGSSLGVRRAGTREELEQAIEHALTFDTKVIIEHGLDHPREIECAILGTDHPIASVPGEVVVRHPDGFYSYDAKYIDDGADLLVPAPLSPAQVVATQALALRTYRALDGAGMARVDMFLAADGELYLNEVNTIPGFTAISMYPRLWAASGVEAAALVARLVDTALARHAERSRLRVSRG